MSAVVASAAACALALVSSASGSLVTGSPSPVALSSMALSSMGLSSMGLSSISQPSISQPSVARSFAAPPRTPPEGGASAPVAARAQDAWRTLPSGPERTDALEEALVRTAGTDAYGDVVRAAYDEFQRATDTLRYDGAERLALAMHATARQSWSAWTLALISSRLGEHERALELLEGELAAATEPAARLEVQSRLALAELAAGDVERSRDLLGRCLLAGSRDAAQILAREALATGERARARRLFASLLPPDPAAIDAPEFGTAPWALRGWGLACLPARGVRRD